MTGFCEHGGERCGTVKGLPFLDQLSDRKRQFMVSFFVAHVECVRGTCCQGHVVFVVTWPCVATQSDVLLPIFVTGLVRPLNEDGIRLLWDVYTIKYTPVVAYRASVYRGLSLHGGKVAGTRSMGVRTYMYLWFIWRRFRYLLVGPRKPTNSFRQDIRFPGRDFNMGRHEY